jgi:hypothetical protein
MQLGHFYRAHGAWHLRYRVNGKQVSVKLADYSDEYRTLTSVRPLAEPYLQTANSGQQANGHLNLQQYAETVYFPHAKKSLKPSTYKGYFNLYTKHIEPRIGGLRLLSCTTHNLQRVLWTYRPRERTQSSIFLEHQFAVVGDFHSRPQERNASRSESYGRRRDSRGQANREDPQVHVGGGREDHRMRGWRGAVRGRRGCVDRIKPGRTSRLEVGRHRLQKREPECCAYRVAQRDH